MRRLQKRLQESEEEINSFKQSRPELQRADKGRTSSLHSNYVSRSSKSTQENRNIGQSRSAEQLPSARIHVPTSSRSDDVIRNSTDHSRRPFKTDIGDIKFSLASVTQISSRIGSLLANIKSSDTYIDAAKQPTTAVVTRYAAETDIAELQNCVRKSTRLTYDLSNMWTTLKEEMTKQRLPVRQRDMQQLDNLVNDLGVSSAESDILTMGLRRAKFFDYLANRTISLSDQEDDDSNARDHSKCVADIETLEDKVKSAVLSVKTATDIIERIDRNIDLVEKYEDKNLPGRRFVEKQTDTIHLSNSETSVKSIPESNRFQADTVPKQMSDFNPVRRTRSEPIGGGEVTRRIDKTLSKIRQIERGEYAKDNELCRHLAEQIRALSDRLKELCDEYNVKNVQDSFTEYSAVTLSKLETLARQSRDTVIAAEAQISAYRSNSQALAQKLRDTEELLRESIHECLGVKQELNKLKILRIIEGPTVEDDPRQTFLRTRNVRDADKPKSADSSQQTFFRTIDLDGNETAVKKVASTSHSPRKPEGPFECMFCRQDHKLCNEKIRELNSTIRSLRVEVKTYEKEAKNEKKIAQANKEGFEKVNLDLESEKQSAKETITALESKNTSLLDDVKILRNRLKNMERYRRCEIEGLQTDIKNLKTKIGNLEKQLRQAVRSFENDQKDLELLKAVHTTAQRSKTAVTDIKRLKAQLYQIETDIKHL